MATTVTINSLPTASTIDPVQDILPIYTASATATQGINRNTLLGLASAPVGLTDTQSLTNKTLISPTISGPTLSGTIAGTYTIGGTPTFPSSVVQLTSTQTLTNKTLTSPTINSPTITNATISTDTITGYTSSTSGTLYGIAITSSTFSGSAITAASIGTTALATNAVQANQLATNAITLGYAQITSNSATFGASFAAVTGLSVTVTIPAGGRKVKITAAGLVSGTSSAADAALSIVEGSTQIIQSGTGIANTANAFGITVIGVITPTAGSHTYFVEAYISSGTGTINAGSGGSPGSASPAFILVEAI